jgi:hypothetical protein
MKPREIFGLAVRLLGLLFVYLAIRTLPVVFSGPPPIVVIRTVLTMVFYVGVGWWLVGGAPLLVKRAYPATNGGDHQADCQARVQ